MKNNSSNIFIVIMGLRGGLFAQAATPISNPPRDVNTLQFYATCDSMIPIKAPIDTSLFSKLYIDAYYPDSRVLPVLEYGPPYHGPQYRILTIPSGPSNHFRYDGTTLYNPEEPYLKIEVIPDNALEFNTNAVPFRWGLGFISGAARGLNQTIAFHPDKFFARYPNANRRYWDNSVSWRNKHKNGDPTQGPAFPLSRTALVFLTDGFHATGTLSNVTGVASLSIPLYKGCGKMNIWRHLAQVGITSAGYWLGFHSVYSWWF